MKSTIQKFKLIPLLVLAMLFIAVAACSKDESTEPPIENPTGGDGDDNGGDGEGDGDNDSNLNEINSIIANLSYDEESLLNVKDTGGASSSRTLLNENNTNTGPTQGELFACKTEEYSLDANFDDVAILRPTNGVIFPGALVIGNQGMLDGAPDPLSLGRAPVTLRLDLPGIGDQGTIVVDNPINSSVQSGIDNALEWWNNNAYQEGYVNAANSSYQAATSYSSKQLSLDVGLNVEWATGSLASQFEYESTTERSK